MCPNILRAEKPFLSRPVRRYALVVAWTLLGPWVLFAEDPDTEDTFHPVSMEDYPEWIDDLREATSVSEQTLFRFEETRTSRVSRRERVFSGVLERRDSGRLTLHYHEPERVVIEIGDDRVSIEREGGRTRVHDLEAGNGGILAACLSLDLPVLLAHAAVSVRGGPEGWEIRAVPGEVREIESLTFSGAGDEVHRLVVDTGGGARREFRFEPVTFPAAGPDATGDEAEEQE